MLRSATDRLFENIWDRKLRISTGKFIFQKIFISLI